MFMKRAPGLLMRTLGDQKLWGQISPLKLKCSFFKCSHSLLHFKVKQQDYVFINGNDQESNRSLQKVYICQHF